MSRTGAARGWRELATPDRGLDGLNFFVANIQTGFGPFIAVYLTTRGWTLTAIGFALSLGTITAMASQLPAGALVDAVRSKRFVAACSVLVFAVSAMLFVVRPIPLFVYLAEILHGISSCTLGPAITAMSLALAGEAALGLRLGRNARYGSIGNGIGAALMGLCGTYVSERSVFVLTALFALPALLALVPLAGAGDAPPKPRRGSPPAPGHAENLWHVLGDRRLHIVAACALLFNLANAAMLPLAASALTKRAGGDASLLIAAAIVLPQLIVALLSPTVGRLAEVRGRRLLLLLGFCMLPLRGLLFAATAEPYLAVSIQVFDGFAAACFGVLMPLVISDIAGRSGHFNLCLGVVGLASGVGATVSTTLSGWIGDRFGDPVAFASLAACGLAAVVLVAGALPETRPGA
jgi:MFS family permease